MSILTMDFPKYSQIENERRFLVPNLEKLELNDENSTHIHDLYIENTRTRLRSATEPDGTVMYKLCKKYPTKDSYSGAIVNIYLNRIEHSIYKNLPGKTLSKRRYRVQAAEGLFGVNVFEGHLGGLVLCEAEMPTREELYQLKFPRWATYEVTEDDFFTGGNLTQTTAHQLQEKLDSLGVQ